MNEQPLGFIGVGTMGGTIAAILLRSHKLRVFDLSAERMALLADKGAESAADPGVLADASDVIFTCLPRSADVEAVLFGASGIASRLRPGTTVIDMTTGDPAITRSLAKRLQEQQVAFIDASLAGGIDGALAGSLAIYVGADQHAFDAVLPLLHDITQKVFHAGGSGSGNVMKLVNNVIGATIRAVTCEALVMAAKNGLELRTIAEILPRGSARSFFAETAIPRYLQGSYKANFAAALMVKDLKIVTRMGADAQVPMRIGGLVLGMYETMLNELGGDVDVDMMLALLERQAGTKITGSPIDA